MPTCIRVLKNSNRILVVVSIIDESLTANFTLIPDPQHEQQSSSPSIRAQKPQSAGAALYRSPYPHERKKVHEITKLNKKVEANYAQQLEETNHLKIFKQSVAEQECEVAIESLK